MSVAEPSAIGPGSRLKRQLPYFIAIGLMGTAVDASITYALARAFGFPAALARPPAFIVATIINFALNRSLTFRGTQAPLVRAFLRYLLVSVVGLSVNYAVYLACIAASPLAGITVTPGLLPLYVAIGSGAAMSLTYLGFRFFAFRA